MLGCADVTTSAFVRDRASLGLHDPVQLSFPFLFPSVSGFSGTVWILASVSLPFQQSSPAYGLRLLTMFQELNRLGS